jgi:hypothetical protein
MAEDSLPDALADDADTFRAPLATLLFQNGGAIAHLDLAQLSSIFGRSLYNVSIAEKVASRQLDVLVRTQAFIGAAAGVQKFPKLV